MSPLTSDAHSVPAQQLGAPPPQTSPVVVQLAPPVDPARWVQTRAPAGPRQTPVQQSSSATHGAPKGAQVLAQVRVPVVSGRQSLPQHCAPTEQGSASGRQVEPTDGPRQRSVRFASARQLSVPGAQQSGDFAQSSPTARHFFGIGGGAIGPGAGAQRAIPSGAAMQVPEQQFSGAAHRSCSGLQPEAAAHREGPVSDGWQRPEQQSLSPAHSSNAGWQPGRAWQLLAPSGPPMHGPPQQSEAELQASPATRQNGSSWQVAAPPAPPSASATQSWPQQSASAAHD
jgi:hypothetical protein